MRRSRFILLACLLAAGCGGDQATDQAQATGGADDDARAWQGTWKLVSATSNGEPETGDMAWVVDGDHYNIRLNGRTGADPYSFTLDTKQKHIDVHHHDTPKGTYGGKFKGIYEIKGDSLKVCYDLKGEQYPEAFDAGRGSRRVVFQFQREK
jgi:uncharacterized protein (TIGR03067 family)